MNLHRVAAVLGLALAACSGSSPSSSSHDVTRPDSLAGGWRICDGAMEAGGGPTEYNPLPLGGLHFELTALDGWLQATSSGQDAGSPVTIAGPVDMSTRTWSATVDKLGGTSSFTFSADGTQLYGQFVPGFGKVDVWYGGRDDGIFACASSSNQSAK